MSSERETFLSSTVDYLDIFRVFDEGVIIADAEGKIMFYNDTIARIDGTRPEDALGLPATELYALNDETSLIMRCLRTGRPIVNHPFLYKTRYGRVANTICSVFPLRSRGKVSGAVCFVRDYNLVGDTITSICSPILQEARPERTNATRFDFTDLIGKAPDFLNCVKLAKMAALTPSAVMIHGETGTGKELIAQAMHNYGPGREGPYVAINCAAIPENLLEGILFGTVKGAFTGAADKPGLFEKAGGGTLFLDEVNSMPIGLQAKLLRVVQERKVRRVGSLEEREVSLKVLSSVNEDPHAAIAKGKLRMDLFYRLGVVFVRIPPLRERKEDIALLADHFRVRFNRELGRHAVRVSADARALFQAYPWPGNVRELEHVIEGAMNLLGDREVIELSDLPPYLTHLRRPVQEARSSEPPSFTQEADPGEAEVQKPHPEGQASGGGMIEAQNRRERAAIEDALTRTQGNVSRAAKILGISRQLLHYKIKKHGLVRSAFESRSRRRGDVPGNPSPRSG